jgi:glycosyltransferase involved in cell wall biosynthesis
MRPAPIRYLVDRWERRCVEQARFVILNTESTRQDYLHHYSDLDKERFITIRNHADPNLINGGKQPEFDRYTLLFLGNFRRFLDGNVLLSVLAELNKRGVDEKQIQLVITGECPPQTMALAEQLGVEKTLKHHPYVPYLETGTMMCAADLLVLLSHRTHQRIPAKFYEYTTTRRPIIGVTENPELAELLNRAGGAHIAGHNDISSIADHIQKEMALGRQREISRSDVMFSSLEATERLADLLNRATASPT